MSLLTFLLVLGTFALLALSYAVTVPCGSDQVQIGNRCYQAYRPAARCDHDFSFEEAEAFCQANGGHLASVHSQAQADALRQLIQNQTEQSRRRACHRNQCKKNNNCACAHASRDYFYWIGMQLDHSANGSVNGSSWTDGTSVDYANPLNGNFRPPFVPGRPIGSEGDGSDPHEVCPGGNQNSCVEIYGFGDRLGRWRDQNCNSSHSIPRSCNCTVAAKPKHHHHYHSSSSSSEESHEEEEDQCRDDDALNGMICEYCPPGWTPFQGHCYMAVPSVQQNAAGYETICQNLGSNASSIHNEAENKFITQLAAAAAPNATRNYVPMRLVKASTAENARVTSAVWTDGTPVDYGNPTVAPWNARGVYPWSPLQPNNRELPADCVQQALPANNANPPETWNDEPCTNYPRDTVVCKIL